MSAVRIADEIAESIAGGRLRPGDRLPSVRALAAERGCATATVVRAYAELQRRGLIEARDRARAIVATRTAVLRVAGSDDPALDLLLRAARPAATLAPGARGSLHGLAELARGAADAAAVHLSDAGTGRHNDPFVRRLLGGEPTVLVRLWDREQGLVLPVGNPRGVRDARDLAALRLVWRAPGAGSRLLFERLLRDAGVEPRPQDGEQAESHLGVAAAVAAGAADAGLAVRAAADATGLAFVPLAAEPFELALREADLPAAGPLLRALASADMRRALDALGGYDAGSSGAIRRAV
jgi:molybdate-binding protein